MKKKLRRAPLSDNDLAMSIKRAERKLARLKKEKEKRKQLRTTPSKPKKKKVRLKSKRTATWVPTSPGGRCGYYRCAPEEPTGSCRRSGCGAGGRC
jgi:hypothetical protein